MLNYTDLISKFEETDGDPEIVLSSLERNRKSTLKALWEGTLAGKFKLDKEIGRKVWRTCVEFYMRKDKAKADKIREYLYMADAPKISKFGLEFHADWYGFWATFIRRGNDTEKRIRSKEHYRYVMKRLYPEGIPLEYKGR